MTTKKKKRKVGTSGTFLTGKTLTFESTQPMEEILTTIDTARRQDAAPGWYFFNRGFQVDIDLANSTNFRGEFSTVRRMTRQPFQSIIASGAITRDPDRGQVRGEFQLSLGFQSWLWLLLLVLGIPIALLLRDPTQPVVIPFLLMVALPPFLYMLYQDVAYLEDFIASLVE